MLATSIARRRHCGRHWLRLMVLVGAWSMVQTRYGDKVEAPEMLPTGVTERHHEKEAGYSISNDIPTCRGSDEGLNECIREAFEFMMPRLKDGNDELNIPPLDPFKVNRTSVQFSRGGLGGRLTLMDALIHGMLGASVRHVDFKVIENNSTLMKVDIFTPRMVMNGTYKASFAINNVKLRPQGLFNITFLNITSEHTVEGVLYEKDGHRFVRVEKANFMADLDDMKINVTGLFPDPLLNEVAMNIANQYWRQIYHLVLPETQRYVEPILLHIINEVNAKVPYDLLIKTK